MRQRSPQGDGIREQIRAPAGAQLDDFFAAADAAACCASQSLASVVVIASIRRALRSVMGPLRACPKSRECESSTITMASYFSAGHDLSSGAMSRPSRTRRP